VGAHVRRARALLSLPAALPHRRRPIRFCFIRVNQGGKLLQLGLCLGQRAACKLIPSRKNRSITFFPEREYFRSAPRAATWAASFVKIGTSSKSKADQVRSSNIPPEDIVALAIRNGCPSSRSRITNRQSGRYVIDICHAAREVGIKTVMVTERLRDARSVPRYLRSRGRRQCGPESFHGRILRPRHAYASAAGARYAYVA